MKLVDVYCPRCWGFRTELTTSFDHGGWYWDCSRCGSFRHPSNADAEGDFEWTWSDDYPAPNPGCPWCGTRHLEWAVGNSWHCLRSSCGRMWQAHWTRKRGQDWKTDRWLIKVPVSGVPWRRGTQADLECARNGGWDWEPGSGGYHPTCCRWPKSCSAFDPGYTTGVGPLYPAGADPLGESEVDDDDCGNGCEYICYHD